MRAAEAGLGGAAGTMRAPTPLAMGSACRQLIVNQSVTVVIGLVCRHSASRGKSLSTGTTPNLRLMLCQQERKNAKTRKRKKREKLKIHQKRKKGKKTQKRKKTKKTQKHKKTQENKRNTRNMKKNMDLCWYQHVSKCTGHSRPLF